MDRFSRSSRRYASFSSWVSGNFWRTARRFYDRAALAAPGVSFSLLDIPELLSYASAASAGSSLSMSTRALSSCITSSVRFDCTDSIVSPKSGPASSTVSVRATNRTFPAGSSSCRLRGSCTCPTPAATLGVGREQDRQVGLALVQHLVAQPDVHRGELLELEPVVVLEADQAVHPLAALGGSVQGEILRFALEIGDRAHPQVFGGRGRAADGVRARERRRRVRRQPSCSNSACESSNACCAFGTSSGGVLKNEVSAVDVYSG